MTKTTKDSKSARKDYRKYLARQIVDLPKSGIREFFDLVNTMQDVISLGVGEPDFSAPWAVRESGIFSLEKGHTGYTSNLGLPALREEICRYLKKNYNVAYAANECMVTIGVSEALDDAIRALVNPGDEVIYAEPCFVSYAAEITMAHGVPVPVPTYAEQNFRLNPAELKKAITPRSKLLLINFPNNPTGATMSLEDLKQIAAIAVKHDLLVITDEVYSELVYDGAKHVSIAALPGMRERTVFLHGFSKSFAMTGLRIGYACAPEPILEQMLKIHQYAIMCASVTAQEAALEALRNGAAEREKMRRSYEERRNVIVSGLNKAGLPTMTPKGAFYVFADIRPTGMTSREFAEALLREKNVAVIPGGAFGKAGEGFVRCCYATSLPEIRTAIVRIAEFCREHKKPEKKRR